MAAALLAAVLFFPTCANAISAESAVLMDAQTGRVLYEKNAEKQGLIASTTKIMTALVVCEQCNVLDRVRIPEEAVGIEGSSIYLQAGEVLTVQDLLYGLMLHSGNDAAVALSIYCGGTVEGFVQLMNDKAYRLGLEDTHFVNPNGLDAPGHYSTAKDLAILASHAMENPVFRQTVSTKTVKAGNRILHNHNKLLWQVEGADGVKTGYTRAAGRILVSSATRDGRRMIAVTMNDPDDWYDHAMLIENGFSQYSVRQLVEEGDHIATVDVAGGTSTKVQLLAAEDFSYALTSREQPRIVIPGAGFVYAPVERGQDGGYAYVLLGECVIGKISLVFGESIEQKREPERSFWQRAFGGHSE